MANAKIVIFSKCENESPDVLAETEKAIRGINPDAEIISRHYTLQDDEWWRSVMNLSSDDIEAVESEGDIDGMSQITLNDAHLDNPAQLVVLLEDCLRGELGCVARAKGTVPCGSETIRFDLADNLYSVIGSDQDTDQCVFIGKALDKASICRRMGASAMNILGGKEIFPCKSIHRQAF